MRQTTPEQFKIERVNVYLTLFLITLIGCYLAWLYRPNLALKHTLTIGTGYLALLMVVVTLLIGPYNLWRQRRRGRAVRNPVNLLLRRDIGIWAGILGCLHVWFSLSVYFPNQPLSFFFRPGPNGAWTLQTDLFGLNNWAGAGASLLLVGLSILSSNLMLRKLGGKRWKNLQRFNYGLFVLVLIHTFGYEILVSREAYFTGGVIGLVGLTLLAQLGGIFLYRAYRRKIIAKPKIDIILEKR